MPHNIAHKRSTRLPAMLLVVATAVLMPARMGLRGQTATPLTFAHSNEHGFGSADNSFSWSMAWFNGNLYVGTNRDFLCVEHATDAFYKVGNYRTNPAPGVTCPASPYDMDLRAEIWCYTPATGQWNRVYQAPADLPNPLAAGKFVARDIGYRDMVVFTEADGTQALYVLGATAREYIPGLPPPRILRSTDGVNFTPIPQDPGSILGNLNAVTFRASAIYNNKLYISASPSMTGDGYVLEATAPALGNSAFRQVTASSVLVYELNVFNGFLYIGAGDKTNGYSVWKTDATGPAPYALTPVVSNGAGRGGEMASVVSMHVFNDRLYVGAAAWYPTLDLTCEMIRINTDDSWDVVVGDPRLTSSGLKFPISGFPDGFGNPWNAHIWRIADHQGALYAGTNDDSGGLAGIPVVNLVPALLDQYGFDLFSSADGRYWTEITQNGFGSPDDFGCRSITSTPIGLFLGSTNYAQGTGVWLGTPAATPAIAPIQVSVAPPARLSIEPTGTATVVSWAPVQDASSYQVFRADYQRGARARRDVWIRGPARAVATTAEPYFRDTSAAPGTRSLYYVQATGRNGRSSGPSNAAITSFVAPAPTFASTEADVRGLVRRGKLNAKSASRLLKELKDARIAAGKGDFDTASRAIDSLHQKVTPNDARILAPTDAEDVEVSVAQLQRRIALTRAGALDRGTLLQPRPAVAPSGDRTKPQNPKTR